MFHRQFVVPAILLLGASCGGCACGISCSKGVCDSGCGSDYAFMKYDACCETCGQGGACGCGQQVGCGDSCDSDCGANRCGSNCGHNARWFGSLLGCAGCGELYWSEWYNDPPPCAEPCDCCGNWIGPGHECTCCSRKPYCGCPYAGRHANCNGCSRCGQGPPPLEVAENSDAITAEMLEK